MLPSGSLCSFRAKVTHILKEKRKKYILFFKEKFFMKYNFYETNCIYTYNFYETKNNLKNKKQTNKKPKVIPSKHSKARCHIVLTSKSITKLL